MSLITDGALDDHIFQAFVDVYHDGISGCRLRHHWIVNSEDQIQFNAIEVLASDGGNDVFNAFAIDLESGAIHAITGERPQLDCDSEYGVVFSDMDIGEPLGLNIHEPGALLRATEKAISDEFRSNKVMQNRARYTCLWFYVACEDLADVLDAWDAVHCSEAERESLVENLRK